MERTIFSITCTTCRVKIAVRSESAIGAILECPKCQSMVQIVPPPGWQPTVTTPPVATAAAATSDAKPAGPPPLSRVAAASIAVELEPSPGFSLSATLAQPWALWTIGLTAALAIAAGLWLLLSPPSQSPSTSSSTSQPPPATTQSPVEAATAQVAEPLKPRKPAPTSMPAAQPETTAAPNKEQPDKAPVTQQLPANPDKPPSTPSLAKPRHISPSDPDPFAAITIDPSEHEAASPAEIKKAPPPMVDVATRLEEPLPEIDLPNIPLARTAEIFTAISTVPITFDADALARRGISPRDAISLKLKSTTVGNALQEAAAQRGLIAVVDNSQAIITTPAEYRETLRQVRYTVSDLTGDNKDAVAALGAIVRGLVVPESWQGVGGRGTIEVAPGALVVTQTGDVHQQILVFCEKLRNARHKPLRSRDNPERFTLATRFSQAQKMLDQPVTLNFHEPTSLAKLVAFLSAASGATIVIDHAALATTETSELVEVTLSTKGESLAAALKNLLRPLGLASRVISPDTIQITTKEAADERLELEFYPVQAWLEAGFSGPKLAERLKSRVAGRTWSDVGGAGEIYFDEPSGCLIVLQSQPTQDAVRRLLALPPPKKG